MALGAVLAAASLYVLRTEHQPPGEIALTVPTSNARFTWQHAGGAWPRGAVQSSFRLQVMPANGTAPVYDSGERGGGAQHLELSPNVMLMAGADYAWRVRAAVAGGAAAAWSAPLNFTTAPSSWSGAQWIGGRNQLRSSFTLPSRPTRARAYVSGLGAFYLYVNGQRVGDHVLDPPQTVYPKRVDYMAFDVLPLLTSGENVVGALLGNYKWGYV